MAHCGVHENCKIRLDCGKFSGFRWVRDVQDPGDRFQNGGGDGVFREVVTPIGDTL